MLYLKRIHKLEDNLRKKDRLHGRTIKYEKKNLK